MLSKSLIVEVDRLLQEGQLSQRKIAALVGVSRGTVSAIALGRRGLHGREPGDDGPDSLVPVGPAERCPRCGYRVFLPCLVCSHRLHRARQKFLRALWLELELERELLVGLPLRIKRRRPRCRTIAHRLTLRTTVAEHRTRSLA